ncbi:peptide ABC transporter substrate-binding protein [Ensifer sp. BR816]|uniref:peptide ABC transporter substrate-binding protein n=1 Tax=Rhizobium sp. (strain BR816) TaxID=1057002 RepID=UPI000362B5DB|nr:peptide ABC transporter substrate-binding protein [Ensifer sp. BR816]
MWQSPLLGTASRTAAWIGPSPSIMLLVALAVATIAIAKADDLPKDTLRLLLWQAPTTLNPHLAPGIKDQLASRINYEPLATFDKNGKLIPFLAAEAPSIENGDVAPDGKSVTWKLRQGVKWSDGKPFTAKDVLFTYRFITNPDVGSSSAPNYKSVTSVEVIDDHTVKIEFKDPTPIGSYPFVGVRGSIIPEHVFADYNNVNIASAPANLAPVGTGPYIANEFRAEDVLMIGEDVVNTVKIIYEPNPFYRDPEKLRFKQVTLQGGGDANVAANAVLRDGVVDYAWNLQVDDDVLKGLEAKGVGKVAFSFGSYIERIMLNFTDPNRETDQGERSSTQFPHPFLTDKLVREAFADSVDREKIAALYGRTGRATANILMAPSIYISPNTSFNFDLAKAAALLDEAGWVDSDGDGVRDKGGIQLRVLYQTTVNPVRQQTQEIVKRDLESIGVLVENKVTDSSIFLGSGNDNTNTRRHFYSDIEEYAYGNKSPDPGAYMRGWICSEAAQQKNSWAGENWSRYCNPAYDALYEQTMTEVDPEKRRQLFVQMNDLLIADAAVVPIVYWADVTGLGKDIEGFDGTPWDSETWNIADWYRKP